MINKKIVSLGLSVLLGLSVALKANAAIVEVGSGFGELPTNGKPQSFDPKTIFGGNGIPADTVTWSLFDISGDGEADLVLGMSATQRFNAPEVTNDGSGAYFAGTGTSSDGRSLWNFNMLAGTLDGTGINETLANAGYALELFYDLDPNSADSGFLNAGLFVNPAIPDVAQLSQNLTFNYLNSGFIDSGVVVSGGTAVENGERFNPFATGTYDFSARFFNETTGESAGVSIDVVVEASTPASLALFSLGILLVTGLRRKS